MTINLNSNFVTDNDDEYFLECTLLTIMVMLSTIFLWKFMNLSIEINNTNNTNNQCISLSNTYCTLVQSPMLASSKDEGTLVQSPRLASSKDEGTEIKDIVEQKEQILEELVSVIKIDNNWRSFNLILDKTLINSNINVCRDTYNLVKNVQGLINAGFTCLEPHTKISYHNDNNHSYKVYIPIIVPEVGDDKIGLIVYDNDRNNDLVNLNKKDYYVFDNEYHYQAYNNTDYHQIVLILDIEN